MVEMTIDSVRVSTGNGQRCVILRDLHQDRYLFIWIMPDLAMAIAHEMQGHVSPRPLTHDLMKTIISELGGQVIKVAVTELRNETYYARITIEIAGRQTEIDARPSDAIALAVRVKCPIFAADEVLDAAAVFPEGLEKPSRKGKSSKGTPNGPEYNLDAYRDFIQSLDILDDFGKEK